MKVFSQEEAQTNVNKIISSISTGGVVVCPSDTTYGILVDATNEEAVKKLTALKERPIGKAISVFVSGFDMMRQYVDASKMTPEVALLLPGSYTIVLPALHHTSKLLEAEDGTLGVRQIGKPISRFKLQIPSTGASSADFVTTLVARYGKPLTATSANISGKGLCYTPQAFLNQLSEKKKKLVDLVIDAGELPHNPPSTVIHLAGHEPVVLRANDRDFVHHKTFHTQNEAETGIVAQTVFKISKPYFGKKPVGILLDGELGGGKTTWTKYFAQPFGVDHIVSPTYTYECEYPVTSVRGVINFKHFDLYNITHEEDIRHLDIVGRLQSDTITCIEWPGQLTIEDRASMGTKAYVVRILFEYTSETERKINMWWN